MTRALLACQQCRSQKCSPNSIRNHVTLPINSLTARLGPWHIGWAWGAARFFECVVVDDMHCNHCRSPADQTAQTRPDQTRPDQHRPDQPRPDQTISDQTSPDQTRLDQTSLDQTRPDQTRPTQTRPAQTRPDQTRPDQPRPDQTRPDQTPRHM